MLVQREEASGIRTVLNDFGSEDIMSDPNEFPIRSLKVGRQ
jgi:hypothetical protein